MPRKALVDAEFSATAPQETDHLVPAIACAGERGAAMGEQIERLAPFAAETQWDEIPEAVRQHAKLVLLDTLGVILAGAEQSEVQQLRHCSQS
jgi:2-methylcitrate dehydratase PrpD